MIDTVLFRAGNERGLAATVPALPGKVSRGLFAWEGKSKGTLGNIQMMADLEKPSVVYISYIKKFVTIRDVGDASTLLSEMEPKSTSSVDLFARTRRTGKE